MKNVIFDNESIIGTKENVWKAFKEEITEELQDNTLDFEEIQTNINDVLDVMKEIQNNEEVYPETYIKITKVAMGGFTYKILKDWSD